MPIVATHVLEARRASAAAPAPAARRRPSVQPPAPEQDQRSQEQVLPAAPLVNPRTRRRGHAVRDASGKWQPTGEGVGWCNPPVATRFQKGNLGGPGRPKGSVSHDTLLKKHLGQKFSVRIGGTEQKLATNELVIMTTVKAAAEGKDREARKYVLLESARIFPPEPGGPSTAAEPNDADKLSLAEFEAELRHEIRENLIREMSARPSDFTARFNVLLSQLRKHSRQKRDSPCRRSMLRLQISRALVLLPR